MYQLAAKCQVHHWVSMEIRKATQAVGKTAPDYARRKAASLGQGFDILRAFDRQCQRSAAGGYSFRNVDPMPRDTGISLDVLAKEHMGERWLPMFARTTPLII